MKAKPVIVPIQQSNKCPSCGKDEKKIECCKHCGHEYKNEPIEWLGVLIIAIMIIILAWIGLTIIYWLFMNWLNESLVEIILSQWEWLKSLKVY